MPKFRHYSPQLSRELVHELYEQAKAQRIPMTVLTNRLLEKALGNRKQTNTRRAAENQHIIQPN
jgi:hypothetical protein